MDLQQFSNEFDIAYNNITSNASPPLNDYEKSVFLTKAQEDLVLTYCVGLNGRYTSFESTEEARRYLDTLVVSAKPLNLISESNRGGFHYYTYEKPKNVQNNTSELLFIVEEFAETNSTGDCVNQQYCTIRPVSYDSLNHTLKNPFKKPTTGKALRVDNSNGIGIISKDRLRSYYCSYIKKPKPIIIDDSQIGLPQAQCYWNIEGYTEPLNPICELPEIMHAKIINRAVALAKAAYVGDLTTQLGLSSQTL